MSYNIINNAQQLITDEMISNSAILLAEEEKNVRLATNIIIPAVLYIYSDNTEDEDSVQSIYSITADSYKTGILNKLASLFNKDSELTTKGSELFKTLLPENKFEVLSTLVSKHSEIKQSSAQSLIMMIVPLVNGLLGKFASNNNMSPMSLASWLSSQKLVYNDSLPNNFNIIDVVQAKSNVDKKKKISKVEKTQINWLWPIVVFLLLSVALWLLIGKSCSRKSERSTTTINTFVFSDSTTNLEDLFGYYDTVNHKFVYNIGEVGYLFLQGKVDPLIVGDLSTESRIIDFITISDTLRQQGQLVDTSDWIIFTGVEFNHGGIELTVESEEQLQNLIHIAEAYPDINYQIACYTFNSGDSIYDYQLTNNRAIVVKEVMILMGLPAERISDVLSCGSNNPILDDETEIGKAVNQRMEIRIIKRY
ncbi:MAG: OmpA family protein [Lentimicrobiaceae bacterium]|nr:OmpA family protein [Lentimicrobiaceae bacterium]